MQELLEKLKTEIEIIKEEENKLQELTEKSEKLKDEKKQLEAKKDEIKDKKSGFYQDIKQQVDEKDEEFTDANNTRMSKVKEIDNLIKKKKVEIQEEIANKKQYIDDNRKVDLKEIDIDKLRAEKEKLDREIELNDITREEFDAKTDAEKAEIRQAKENYLNNKKRLAEINPKIQLIDTLNGKTPKESFMELDELSRNVEENFNKENLDCFLEDIKKMGQEKEEPTKEPEQSAEPTIEPEEPAKEPKETEEPKKQTEEFTKNSEKTKETTKEPEKTREPSEEIKKKLEQIKKETRGENSNYRNATLNADSKIDKSQIKRKKEVDKIASIRINEKAGTIYTKTESGKIEGIALSEAIYHKKSLHAILKISDICKEIAGGRIKGLLLGTKVNPAIVYALRKEPKQIENYITCLKEKKELPFELFHDLRDSSLSVMNRVKMWVHARAEDKLPGTTVILTERRWNKNKTIEAPKEAKKPETQKNKTKAQEADNPFEMYKQVEPNKDNTKSQEVHEPFTTYEQVKRDKNKPIADYYVDNEDNHIEKSATEKILRQEEEKRAKEVEKFMPDTVENRNGEVVADFGENR